MLDDMRKKGKPITPKVEEMALWLDSLDTSSLDDGQVRVQGLGFRHTVITLLQYWVSKSTLHCCNRLLLV